jgi:hypothetical protein
LNEERERIEQNFVLIDKLLDTIEDALLELMRKGIMFKIFDIQKDKLFAGLISCCPGLNVEITEKDYQNIECEIKNKTCFKNVIWETE